MTQPAASPRPAATHWATSFWDGAARLAQAVSARAEGDARWRRALISDMDPRDCDVVMDARCGGGTLALALAQIAPRAIILALDHREDALARARERLAAAGAKVNLIHGHAHDIAGYVNELRPTRIVCTLTEADDHAERRAILAAARTALAPRGTLHIVEPASPTRSLMDEMMAAPAAQLRRPADRQPTIDMMRQQGFVGVLDLGLFSGQSVTVRISRGAAP